jgi:oligopeptide transport system ATP-binding protein
MTTVSQDAHHGPILRAVDLTVTLPGALTPVDGINLELRRGEILGVAGESGSGKTMTALALFGLLPTGARVGGSLEFDGLDVAHIGPSQLRDLRGKRMAMVFQDPMTSLHPMLPVSTQLTEHLRYHTGISKRAALERAAELLAQVRIPDPARTLKAYPHQFSGGMRQRIAIAVALACGPELLVADEPTTALDVTVQAGILRLLDRLRREENLSILLITHDLGVMSALTDRIAVMYAGRIVEIGSTADVLGAPRHPYTRGLLDALPRTAGVGASLRPITGSAPPLTARPSGCAFHPRCGFALPACSHDRPELISINGGRAFACPVDPLVEAPKVLT